MLLLDSWSQLSHIDSPPTPLNLFTDGIELIFSYLNTSDWFYAARSCRHWCKIADSSRRKVTIELGQVPIFSIRGPSNEKKQESSIFQQLFGKKKKQSQAAAPPTSPWHLQSHIESLSFSRTTWNELSAFLHHAHQLSGLKHMAVFAFTPPSEHIQRDSIGSLPFPRSLTSLSIQMAGGSMLGSYVETIPCVDMILNTIGRCTHLKRLVLPRISMRREPFFEYLKSGFSALASLTQLKHLVFHAHLLHDQVERTFTLVGSLTSLTYLDLQINEFENDLAVPVSPAHALRLRLPHLLELYTQLILDASTLRGMSVNLPALEVLNGQAPSTGDLSAWSDLKKLKQLTLRQSPSVDQFGHQLGKMKNLTEIIFEEWYPDHTQFWTELTWCTPPNLTSLQLLACSGIEPLELLISACTTAASREFLQVQLKKLTFHCQVNRAIDVLVMLQECIALTSVTLVVSQNATNVGQTMHRQVYDRFNSSAFLPHLIRCDCEFHSMIPKSAWKRDNILPSRLPAEMLIRYDRETNLNQVEVFGCQVMLKEERLYRDE